MYTLPQRTGSGSKRVVIMGCGRIGASIAIALADQGHSVGILDVNVAAFDLLPPGLVDDDRIAPTLGDGTSEDGLRKASTQEADVFIAMAGKDTRNALAANIAKHVLQVPRVICRMNDPTRKEMYEELGLITVSATSLVTEMVLEAVTG